MPGSELPPHFLGIGAQKSGTTWLSKQMRCHPDLWLTPRKELHYFDRNFPAQTLLSEPNRWRRLFGKLQRHRTWRAMAKSELYQDPKFRTFGEFLWFLKFYFGKHDDSWYRSLFSEGKGRLCGEITPAYSILSAKDVAGIARFAPDLKIILLLRNPIDRAWSHLRYEWTRGMRKELGGLDEIKTFIDSPAQMLRSNYLRTLDHWSAHYPTERIFVGFYDDIEARPAELVARILEFLGVDPARSEKQDLKSRVLVSREAPMPPEIRLYLSQKYMADLEALAERFGEPVTNWLSAAKSVVATASVASG